MANEVTIEGKKRALLFNLCGIDMYIYNNSQCGHFKEANQSVASKLVKKI